MAKTLRKIIITICGAFVLLFGGLFFVGCGEDYSKINIVSDVSSINLEVGEVRNVYVTFQNYQNGFNTQVTTASGLEDAVFSIVSQKLVSKDKVQISIVGIAGGKDELTVTSWDLEKHCTISVFVNQYSSVLSQGNNTFYVSNSTSLLPDSNDYVLSPHTQNYEMSYFYMENPNDESNFFTARLDSIERVEGDETKFRAKFVWSAVEEMVDIRQFDEVKLVRQVDGRDLIELYLDGQLTIPAFLPSGQSFKMLSIYNHSFEVDEDRKLFCVSPVYIMPDIEIEVNGGYYYIDDAGERHINLQPISLDDKNKLGPILIVPNNYEKTDYILQVKMNQNSNFKIEFGNLIQSMENVVDINIFNPSDDLGLDKSDNIIYLKISQNAKSSAEMNFNFDISYDKAQGIEDDSVSQTITCDVVTKIAPNDIAVNGLLGDLDFVVYNFNQTGYGWESLYLDVISGFDTSPDFEGLYFKYDENYLTVYHKNVEIKSGVVQKIDLNDLNSPFLVQGVWDSQEKNDVPLEIYVVSSVLQDDDDLLMEGKQLLRTSKITFDVIGGAHNLSLVDKSEFYLDYDEGTQEFFSYLYSDSAFKNVIIKNNGDDVVDIRLDSNQVYNHEEGTKQYFLRLLITPKALGDGFYKIQLDNGTEMAGELHFHCKKTLKESSTSFQISASGNDDVVNFYYSRNSETDTFDNVLNLEILNKSSDGGSEAYIDIFANVNEINGIDPVLTAEGVLSRPTVSDGKLRLRTLSNGTVTVVITLRGSIIGAEIGKEFEIEDRFLILYVNVISYSLVEDYFLMNGGDYALVNNVYYGGGDRISFQDKQVKLSATVNPEDAFAFFQYSFNSESLKEFFENSRKAGENFAYEIDNVEFDKLVSSKLVPEYFSRNDKKFIYFTAMRLGDTFGVTTSIYVEISKSGEASKRILLEFLNGIMFYPEDEITYEDEYGVVYTAKFVDKTFSISTYGTFNLDTFTYQDVSDSAYQIVLSSNIRQRNQTKRYDARISSISYKSVDYISLVSAQTNLDFSNGKLTQSIGVAVYPSFATNTHIQVQFVTTNGNPYDGEINEVKMVEASWNDENNGTGIYTIQLSCENFYDKIISQDALLEGVKLTGILYIYPVEWATSYTSIPDGLEPIALQVQYRNGTRENPYIIETTQDILNMNSEASLASHYEIRTTIDMRNVQLDRPIGVLMNGDDMKVVPFTGSIIGTTSQASLINLNINNNNFTKVVDGTVYSGLFAEIKSENFAEIQNESSLENLSLIFNNFTISGKINLDLRDFDYNQVYIGLLSSVNAGKILNVQINIEQNSQIFVKDETKLHFGGVSALNYGSIVQDFRQYNQKGDASEFDGQKFVGQSTKNIVYFNGDFTKPMLIDAGNNSTIYAGGVVGANNGVIVRKEIPNDMKIYGYGKYSAYTQIKVVGNGTINLGGISGVTAYVDNNAVPSIKDFFIELDNNNTNILLQNLLVGGEVNALTVSNSFVGGLSGLINTFNINSILVDGNTSRVFVRGNCVGGLFGRDGYRAYDETNRVVLQSTNVMEAVDDGRSPLYASQIISLQGKSNGELANAKNLMFGQTDIDNYVNSNKENAKFEIYTYCAREQLSIPEFSISPNVASTTGYYGDWIYVTPQGQDYIINSRIFFTFRSASVNFGSSEFEMPIKEGTVKPDNAPRVFFAYFFDVTSKLNGERASQEDVEDMNFLTSTQTDVYPFRLNSEDVSMASETSNLGIDINGNLIVRQTGIATVRVSSILNIVQSQTVYLWIVNYFDKNVTSSIFYTSLNSDGVQKTDGGSVHVYGNSYSQLYLKPSYQFSGQTYNGDRISISSDGIVSYKGVAYNLVKNTQLGVSATQRDYVTDSNGDKVNDGSGNVLGAFSNVQIKQQTINFYKQNNAEEGYTDSYTLVPTLEQTISFDGEEYTYLFPLKNSKIDLNVTYHETATRISVEYKPITLSTSGDFDDFVTVESTRDEELLFYDILGPNRRTIQNRMPNREDIARLDADEDAYLAYMNTITEDDLFKITFKRSLEDKNVFQYYCSLNTKSTKYINRFKESIFGEYMLVFYSSELEDGKAYCEVPIHLDEEFLGYAMMTNYSNWQDVSVSDNIIVPSRRGLLEISLSPTESVFDKFTLSNDARNSGTGAANAIFEFVYQRVTEEGVEFVRNEQFGTYEQGAFSFTYKELIEFYQNINNTSDFEASYYGKIFISYVMPSRNVDDNVEVAFNLSVTHGNDGNAQPIEETIELTTKLSSYAKMTIDDKPLIGDAFYVARGLSYNISLDYFGFSEDDITITCDQPEIVEISKENRLLTISPNPIHYFSGEEGLKVTVTTRAYREVDGVPIESIDEQTIYVMEYVLNYNYEHGVNEDIVSGMNNGVINIAIGNPYQFEFSIKNFLEYNSSIDDVNKAVDIFVQEMTSKVEWKVFENGEFKRLREGYKIESPYYKISSFIFTPLKIYDHSQDIYHFTVQGHYTMNEGCYVYSAISTNTNLIYTEFAFDVHEQSTDENPIPVETYEDLMKMQNEQFYILLNDIVIPDDATAKVENLQKFTPITNEIAGLDGNSYSIYFGGTYDFSDISDASVGLFRTVANGALLRNVKIALSTDVQFRFNTTSYNVGLLASQNYGVITNCEVSFEEYSLTVENENLLDAQDSSSTVAGLVAINGGYITNSRSSANIFASANLSGFVGSNSKKISSSYFRGGKLKNLSNNSSVKTAGLVISNESQGQIATSYVSGDLTDDYETGRNEDYQYYNGSVNVIESKNSVSGFVSTNSGQIANCYSNIMLRHSGQFGAGFVLENSGTITECFSTSVLESHDDSNFGFAKQNSVMVEEEGGSIVRQGGTISDSCFFLSQGPLDEEGNPQTEINSSIGEINEDDDTKLRALTLDDFADNELKNFDGYSFVKGRRIHSVWFFVEKENSSLDNFKGASFNTGRLELVAPNIIATSKREFYDIEVVRNPETGAEYNKYIYVFDSSSPALGSLYNPIVIENASNMEKYITQENDRDGYNHAFYRLASDINYSSYLENSQTFSTKFLGYFEGNYMEISNQNLVSNKNMMYAGLFAEVGNSQMIDSIGTLMNFTFAPKVVHFANASVVGGLAGKLDSGTIVNVDVNGVEEQEVVGNNIVGGAVGLTVGRFKIQNVNSHLSARARLEKSTSNNFDSATSNYSTYSFAGSLVGVLSGSGGNDGASLSKCNLVGASVSVTALKAGLMFGLIDSEVVVSYLNIDMHRDMVVNAHRYGGLVAGESRGIVKHVTINAFNETELFTNFKTTPQISDAVGGFAGLISGGELEDLTMSQSISVSTNSNESGIKYLGGIAGEIAGDLIASDIHVENVSLVGFQYVGGFAGVYSSSDTECKIDKVVISGNFRVCGVKLNVAGMGGLIAFIKSNASVKLTASESDKSIINIKVSSVLYNYDTEVYLNIGTIVGMCGELAGGTGQSNNVTVSNTECYLYSDSDSVLVSGENLKNLNIVNVTLPSTTKVTLTAKGNNEKIDRDESNSYLQVYYNPAENTTYEIDLTFSYMKSDKNLAQVLNVSLYGNKN